MKMRMCACCKPRFLDYHGSACHRLTESPVELDLSHQRVKLSLNTCVTIPGQLAGVLLSRSAAAISGHSRLRVTVTRRSDSQTAPNADTARREERYGGADCAEGGGSGHDGLYAEVVVKSSSQRLTQSFPRIMLRLAVLLSAGGF
jgi:hypothetical protein